MLKAGISRYKLEEMERRKESEEKRGKLEEIEKRKAGQQVW